MSKATGYKVEQVVWPLEVANKGLVELEQRYNNLKSEVDWLEVKKQSLVRMLEDYNRQVASLGKTLDSYFIRCEQEAKKLADLQVKRMKEENIMRRLENNKAEIRKIAEEKVRALLSNRRDLLNLAALCITEAIREHPEKYRYLVQREHEPSVMDSTTSDFNSFSFYGQSYLQPQHQRYNQSKVYFIEDYAAMLADDAQKILEEIVKELSDEIINGYTVNKSSPHSLHLLPSDIV